METTKYPALAAFIIRLTALAMFVAGGGALTYWLLFMRLLGAQPTLAEASGLWQMGFGNGGFLLIGSVVLFALSRPLGRLVGHGL